MATITSTGLGSGIDVNTIVPQLVAAERKATDTRLDTQEATTQAKISSWGTFKSALSAFQSSFSALKLPSTFQKVSSTSSDSSSLGVSASTTADTGSYRVEVEQLAQQHTLASTVFADPNDIVGNGTLVIKFGATDYDKDTDTYNGFTLNADKATANITIDSSNNTLTGVRDAINKADIGVRASIVNDGNGYRLVMSTEEGGADNSMQISVADSDGNHTDTSGLSVLAFNDNATHSEQTLAGQNAALKINGLAVTSTTNQVTTALKGVTLDLLQAQVGKTVQVDIKRDDTGITDALNSFVEKFNELNSTVNDIAGYNSETKTGGILQGDILIRSAMSQVRSLIGTSVEGISSSVKSLVDIGFKTQSDGSLELDEDRLNEALTNDRAGVAALFTAHGESSDSGVGYFTYGTDTKVGTYGIEITEMATQGVFTGGALSTTTIDATNDRFRVNVNGTLSNEITLTQGDYTTTTLLAEIQSRINGDSAIKSAGAAVDVTFNAAENRLEFTSKRYGSASGVAFFDVAGTGLGLDTGSYTSGKDVAGTIGGAAATGNGQMLTASEGDAEGLAINVLSGSTGDRGTLHFTRGIMGELDSLLSGLVNSSGSINSRIDGLESNLDQIDKDRDALNLKMEKYETRLYNQFNAMDLVVAKLQSTSEYLTQQLASLPYSNMSND